MANYVSCDGTRSVHAWLCDLETIDTVVWVARNSFELPTKRQRCWVEGQLVGEDMEHNEHEVKVRHVVCVFASASLAEAFENCLNTGTLATCKESRQPIAINPPAVLGTDLA